VRTQLEKRSKIFRLMGGERRVSGRIIRKVRQKKEI
jgi:hypothetical protein